jgi:hypothetical protein
MTCAFHAGTFGDSDRLLSFRSYEVEAKCDSHGDISASAGQGSCFLTCSLEIEFGGNHSRRMMMKCIENASHDTTQYN